ncbi:MAG: alanine--tRNA ligase [Chlamydiota bacterium]
MLSNILRKNFLAYFAKHGHKPLPSSPLLLPSDPTLLFVNAGMNPFKEWFLGKEPPPYPRVTTVQKCLRAGGKHNDLANVGHTERHLTFFEMLGNFSFGDYSKQQAIAFAFEVATTIFSFPVEKLWASVFLTDDEAFTYWKNYLPEERIVRLGESDNFWSMGDVGPCGPCSELYYDQGSLFSSAPSPKFDPEGARYIEFWNLVFMEEEKTGTTLSPLPQKNIDTGAGLERILALMEGKKTVFDTDILYELILKIESLSGVSYQSAKAPHFRIIADHMRSLSFAISDKILPSNTKEGYVLRKILRRAARSGKQLGLKKPFLAQLLPTLQQGMQEAYPELKNAGSTIETILTSEEESYLKTLEKGEDLFEEILSKSSRKKLSGKEAFTLKDTYGFPLEEILLLAKDHGISVDIEEFQALEKKARALSKQGASSSEKLSSSSLLAKMSGRSSFCRELSATTSPILALIKDHTFVTRLEEGEEGYVVLETTPFYPEKGGQVGDQGELKTTSSTFLVQDTQEPISGVILHQGKVTTGFLQTQETMTATLDHARRSLIAKHHTTAHLLQWALQKQFGASVAQQGSLVTQEKCRFDFSYPKALTEEELFALETLMNEKIVENIPVLTYETLYEKVESDPQILQFFGDKYGRHVRVVDMGFSKELCGGTHARSTGALSLVCITKETAIAKGVRRIEVKASTPALQHLQKERRLLSAIQKQVKAPKDALLEKLEKDQAEQEALRKKCRALEKMFLQNLEKTLLEKASGSPSSVIEIVPLPLKELPSFADQLAKTWPEGTVILGAQEAGRCQIAIRLSPSSPFHAKTLVQEIAPIIEGGGGGKKSAANAGGKNGNNLPLAIETLKRLIHRS